MSGCSLNSSAMSVSQEMNENDEREPAKGFAMGCQA
jgi:hypothetical protein